MQIAAPAAVFFPASGLCYNPPMLEIEVKSLLGSAERAAEVKKKLLALEPRTRLISRHRQLNHYFVGGNLGKLQKLLSPKLTDTDRREFNAVVKSAQDFSVRTRLNDAEQPIFVVKTSLDEGTSHNTVSRKEFEIKMKDTTLEELDRILLDAGFEYQAKWSREREEYKSAGVNVCFDRNAGYGYIIEFEKVVDDESLVARARQELFEFMGKLRVKELPQDRLERMFKYYNENWRDYYGTEKTFTIQ